MIIKHTVKYFQQKPLRGIPENSCADLEKAIYSIKKYLPIQYMMPNCSENSEHPWWSHFGILVILEFSI